MQRKTSSSAIGGPKKHIPGPTNLNSFVKLMILHLCRKVLFIDTSVKIGVYFVGIFLGSIICDLFPLPRSYFSNSKNFINVFFVKLGWGWTLLILSIHIIMTTFTITCGDWSKVKRHLGRLVVGTFVWYFWTTLFEYIEHQTGVCSDRDFDNKKTCYRSGHIWLGFDISGHCFLLVHNLLLISEEVKVLKNWDKIPELIEQDEHDGILHLTEKELSQLQISYRNLTPFIRVMMVVLTIFTWIWELMLVSTTLYFHNMIQKVTAVLIAIVNWFLVYQVLYPSKNSSWIPQSPGVGGIRYQKTFMKRQYTR
ncbi:unnamed protein product [Owenia fusiformis]|uniref:Uncharacterized protein n=1 Tax=Owenia fusiformis TaxID=6347 RepID=A0A8J1UNP9_OWEFU|nr:unnamed protein product [Owenia fusiformis]